MITTSKEDTSKLILLEELGQTYRDEKRIDSSIIYFKKALELNEKLHYSLQKQCWDMASIDWLLYVTGHYIESLKYANRVLALSQKLNDTFQVGIVNLVFGHDYRSLDQYRLSLTHFYEAKKTFKTYWTERNKPEDNIYTIQCIGEVYIKMNQLDSALHFSQQAMALAVKDSNRSYILLSMRMLGDIYLARGDELTALNYYRKYIPLFKQINENNRDLAFVYNKMAKIFKEKGQDDSLVLYAKKAMEHAQHYSDLENLYYAGMLLSNFYEDKNDHAAFTYLKKADQARDSLWDIEKLKHAQILAFNAQVHEKEKIEREAKEARKTRMIIVITSIFVSLISFLLWNRIRQLRLKHKVLLQQKDSEKLKAKYEKELLQVEAKALRAQMNPHFIYNCMNSIKALIQSDNKSLAVEYLTTFSKLIRTIFHNSDKRQISLYDEIETCKLYTQLEAMRLNGKLQYKFCIDPNVDLKSLMVPALIVQPFIENAIWHGIVPKSEGTIRIAVKGEEDKIICEVDDDGVGRESSRLNKPITPVIYESKGVKLSQQRLDLEKMINNNDASLQVIDKYHKDVATGTKVILSFNFN